MKPLHWNFTLPELQARLDRLPERTMSLPRDCATSPEVMLALPVISDQAILFRKKLAPLGNTFPASGVENDQAKDSP
jgi:hypothetical protein